MLKFLICAFTIMSFPVFAKMDITSDYQFYLHKRMARIQKDESWVEDNYKIGQVNAYYLFRLFMYWQQYNEDYKKQVKELIAETVKRDGWINDPFCWGRLNVCFEMLDILSD